MRNAADAPEVRVLPSVADPDGDALSLSAYASTAAVADADIDPHTGEIVLRPRSAGTTSVRVTVDDGFQSASTSFLFSVADVTRTLEISAAVDGSEAIRIANGTTGPTAFTLTHNGHRTFESAAEIVEHVRDMPAEFGSEPFERKLWRFVRDNVYHANFLDPDGWKMSPTTLVNSLGFGLCSTAAAAYVELARHAGFEARIWVLNGHVVPEIRAGGRWQMFDPDLAIYYLRPDAVPAAVADLSADPGLVATPISPLFSTPDFAGYSQDIAAIYASTADNFLWDILVDLPAGIAGRITLPAGAALVYPGRWTEAPLAAGDGGPPTPVTEYAQAALELPRGWTGRVILPWVAWDVVGEGTVQIAGEEFAVGLDALRQRLRDSDEPIPELYVTASTSDLRVVFLISPLRYELMRTNVVELTGLEVWRAEVSRETLPAQFRGGGAFPAAARKPVP